MQKTAPIIAGAVAALAIIVERSGTVVDVATGLLYLVPLGILFSIVATRDYADAPDTIEMKNKFFYYPKTFLKVTLFVYVTILRRTRS